MASIVLVSALGVSVAQAADAALVWAKAMGGTSFEYGYGIAVDADGYVYTTGSFIGTADFDPGTGVTELTSVGESDAFVQKLDPDGNLVWVIRMGDTGRDSGLAVAVDLDGNVYTTGTFNVPAAIGPGHADVFVQKLDPDGNLLWTAVMGGPGNDVGLAIAIDAERNVFTTGSFAGRADFDPGVGVVELMTPGSGLNAFVQKLDPSGAFVWAVGFGGLSGAGGSGIAVDADGDVYTTGSFIGTADFDPGAGVTNLTSAGDYDAFVQKLDQNGDFIWADVFGGPNAIIANGIAVDTTGNVFTTGFFYQTADFDPGPDVTELTSAGTIDVFVQKLDTDGDFLWVAGMGGTGNDEGTGVAVDEAGNVYTAGYFNDTVDFDPGAGVTNLISTGSNSLFVQKLDPSGAFVWAAGASGVSQGRGVAVGVTGDVHTTGIFFGTTDFNPSAGVTNLTSAGSADVFVQKLHEVDDGTAPLVTLTTPANSATFDQGEVVFADYWCTDEAGGSGIATCIGDVADGAAIDTTTLGANTFTVVGTDIAGNPTTVVNNYTVVDVTPPAVTVTTPADAAMFEQGEVVLADYECTDEVGGSGIDTCVGDVADGSAIDTATTGSHTFTVVGTDNSGNPTTIVNTYIVFILLDPDKTICDDVYSGSGADVEVPAGATCTLPAGTEVSHDVQVKKGGTLIMDGTTVGHSLKADKAAAVTVCSSIIDHDLSVKKTSGEVVIGGSGCDGNAVGKNLKVEQNAGAVTVSDNAIGRDLTVQENRPAGTTVNSNSAGHNASCKDNSPQTGSGNTAVGKNTCPM